MSIDEFMPLSKMKRKQSPLGFELADFIWYDYDSYTKLPSWGLEGVITWYCINNIVGIEKDLIISVYVNFTREKNTSKRVICLKW